MPDDHRALGPNGAKLRCFPLPAVRASGPSAAPKIATSQLAPPAPLVKGVLGISLYVPDPAAAIAAATKKDAAA